MTDAVGIQTGPIFDDPDTRAKGVDAIPSTLGERFLGDFASNPTQEIGRAFGRYFAATGVDPSTGIYTGFQPAAPISPDEANTRYGISDHLEFTNPINPDVAASMYDAKRAELQQQDVLRRQPSGVGNTVAGLGTDFLAASLDPLSIASTFIPVVGQARYARWLEEAGSTLARTGIRAGVGAAQGVVGQAPLVALRYGLSQQEGADYSATDALLDLTYGGILGAGLNAGAGAVADLVHGSPRAAPEAATIAEAQPEIREAALRTAIAQSADGRPVEVTPFFAKEQPAPEAPDPMTRQATRYAAGEPLPEHAAMSNMAEQATAAPSEIDQQIAELEGMVRHGQSTGELPAMIPELDAANVGVTRAQAVKRGIAQAAFCLARGGA